MKSTSGHHFIALDQIRAIAAFMVVTWHFIHNSKGVLVPLEFTPSLVAFLLALFDEGHTGGALFMTLSGYLFAKLLNGKNIHHPAFIWNRILRLLPLLILVILLVGVTNYSKHRNMKAYFTEVIQVSFFLPYLMAAGQSLSSSITT